MPYPSVTDPAILSLEQQIGFASHTGTELPLNVTKLNRSKIISWLIIKGLPKSNCDSCSDGNLAKLYGFKEFYLRAAIENEKSGKNRYKQRNLGKIDFDASEPFSDDKIDFDFDNTQQTESQSPISKIEIQTLVRTLIRDTLSKEISQELIKNRQIVKQESADLLDSIMKEVQEDVKKSLEKNRETTEKVAREVTENKIKVQEKEITSLVEDIIFQSYLGYKVKNQEKEIETKDEETIPNTISQNIFIPKLDPNYHFDPYATKVIRSALSMCENLYVYGDTGCGKTTHLEQVCSVLNRGLIRINPHDGITREMFLGGMKLINNETKFIEGALPLAMRNGYVFLVDEISFLPPNLTAILNPIGEKGGKLYIPETSEWISPAPGFCIFATDNTGGKGDRTGNYTGTEVQNTATLDRFAFCIKMDYLPEEKEFEMLEKRFPNQDQDEIQKLLSLAKEIRSAFSRGELSITLSTRKLIKFFDQRENNFSISEALSNTILSWLDEDDETLVKTMIDRLDIISQDITNEISLTLFHQEVKENNIVSAIRILREIVDSNSGKIRTLSLREAELTEQYRDGLISIQDVENRLQQIIRS